MKQGKPHPDIFMEAANRIATDPLHLIDYSKFLAFEDSIIGVTVRLPAFVLFSLMNRFLFLFFIFFFSSYVLFRQLVMLVCM